MPDYSLQGMITGGVDRFGDLGDEATCSLHVDINADLLERRRRIELSQARYGNRVRRGVGEICENCEKPIPPNRRKAVPETTFCAKCQSERETIGRSRR